MALAQIVGGEGDVAAGGGDVLDEQGDRAEGQQTAGQTDHRTGQSGGDDLVAGDVDAKAAGGALIDADGAQAEADDCLVHDDEHHNGHDERSVVNDSQRGEHRSNNRNVLDDGQRHLGQALDRGGGDGALGLSVRATLPRRAFSLLRLYLWKRSNI